MADATLYEQLGGKAAIDAAVDKFYEKMLADDRVSSFFSGVDMDGQRNKQRKFLAYAFGGPVSYTGKDMREGHAHLLGKGLNDSHVDVVIEHLGNTLLELGVAEELVKQVAAIAEGARDDVLSR